jgi:TIR domain
MDRQIFISHNRGDDEWCKKLHQDLCRRLHTQNIYLDVRNNLPGVRWKDHLWSVFEKSTIFLIVVSPHAASSAWVKDETRRALELVKRDPTRHIIPLLRGRIDYLNDINPELTQFHVAHFQDEDRHDKELDRLVYVLNHPGTLGTGSGSPAGGAVISLPDKPWWHKTGQFIWRLITTGG